MIVVKNGIGALPNKNCLKLMSGAEKMKKGILALLRKEKVLFGVIPFIYYAFKSLGVSPIFNVWSEGPALFFIQKAGNHEFSANHSVCVLPLTLGSNLRLVALALHDLHSTAIITWLRGNFSCWAGALFFTLVLKLPWRSVLETVLVVTSSVRSSSAAIHP